MSTRAVAFFFILALLDLLSLVSRERELFPLRLLF
nr:MAG TPA: hypothetical protein [Caudoviricetes sp.]